MFSSYARKIVRVFLLLAFLTCNSVLMATDTIIKPDPNSNHLAILRDPQLRMFIEDLLQKYWEISRLPVSRLDPMLNILAAYSDEPEFALQLVQEMFPDLTDRQSDFYSAYQDARSAKFRKFSRSLVPYIKGTVLADVGGEDTKLVDVLTTMIPTLKKAYVTDINMSKQMPSNEKIEFLWQPLPEKTPLDNGTVDSIILSTMLHHIDPFVRLKLVTHLKEVLRDGGRLILIEDTYPEHPADKDIHNALDERFLAFSDPNKKEILSFLDWWGNRLMKNSRDIPLPCTFKSMEEWEDYFAEIGLKLVQKQYLGIPDMHTHIMAPKGILIFEYQDESKQNLGFTDEPHIVQSIVRVDTNRETLAFRPNSGVNINLSIGGSKMQTTVVDQHLNELIHLKEYCWRKDFRDCDKVSNADSQTKREWLIDRIVEQIEYANRQLKERMGDSLHVEGVGVAWAGPVKPNGLIVGPNIDGFKFSDLTSAEREAGGVPLAQLIGSKLGSSLNPGGIDIQFLNDGDAAAIANFQQAKLDNGLLLTIGTGIGSGIVSNGKVLYSVNGFKDRIGEIGHHILYHPTHHRYFYYGVLTRGRIVEEMTPHSISQRLAGPGLAKKFVTRMQRELGYDTDALHHFLNSSQDHTAIRFSEIELAACEANEDLGPIIEKKILKLVTYKANQGNKSAISFIKEVGYEIGLGIGVFIKEFEKEGYVRHLIVSGSVGKSFGKGLADEHGNDLFLSQISKGIDWSMNNHYAEMNPQLMMDLSPKVAKDQQRVVTPKLVLSFEQ